MPHEPQPAVQSPAAYTRVLVQRLGRGTKAKGIRRAFLVERETDRILELETAFLDHEFGLSVLNTQKALLVDLAFFHQWCLRKRTLDRTWLPPAHRAAANLDTLTKQEVNDLARWCQHDVLVLIAAAKQAGSGVRKLPLGEIVAHGTRNRRLRYISRYLQWLTVSLATDENTAAPDVSTPEIRSRTIKHLIDKKLIKEPKSSDPKSLTATESRALRSALADKDEFPSDDVGTRDRLIFELLLQGLRAGEVLKIRCIDVYEDYPQDGPKIIAAVNVVRKANDIDDTRISEPAVKTLTGLLPIPRRLAKDLTAYICSSRREAVNLCRTGDETQYLFVNHSGPRIGQATSQRNINRVVAKLKGRFELPEDLHPHSMRHTHFTELADNLHKQGRSDQQIGDLLIHRGRWVPNSKEPARYTQRAIVAQSADYIEARDAELQGEVSGV
ncbi:MAG: site-specific integrase [Burkholderiales bacterium]|nr:site-specific integrase [Burkholderiales bacterium]